VRQGQQNRRGRGRNRKSQNPLARSFESNGPDVKIRGTPAHIAEKYISLARDAQSSGDPVLAENYLQHAEHYSRIIMAYREQMIHTGDPLNGNGQRSRLGSPIEVGESGEDFIEEEGEDILDEGVPVAQPGHNPQPHHQNRQGGHYEGNRHDRQHRRDHGRFRDRDRHNDRDRHAEGRGSSNERQADNAPDDARRRERYQQMNEQPDFLRRPAVRRQRPEGEETDAPAKEDSSRD
jgi:hypothetical protein